MSARDCLDKFAEVLTRTCRRRAGQRTHVASLRRPDAAGPPLLAADARMLANYAYLIPAIVCLGGTVAPHREGRHMSLHYNVLIKPQNMPSSASASPVS